MKFILSLLAASAFAQFTPAPIPTPYKPTDAELQAIKTRLSKPPSLSFSNPDVSADVAVYFKAGEWILRHPEEFLTKAYYDNTVKVLDAGQARARELESGHPSWPDASGRIARGYRSRIDGSFQPYVVIIPETYRRGTPIRLDVVLHGRNQRLNEVSFLADAEWGKPVTPLPDRIELHVFGRTNNAYRWAGETDVFEALDAVLRNYTVDQDRIVLRGFSMGGAGAWHIGLHYPARWAAIEAGAGFSETLRYAKLPNAPEYQKRAWTIYDAYLYARNALMVPTVGYGSIDDPQLQASVNIKEQLAKEQFDPAGLRALFLVGPPIGHKFDPEKKKESEDFISKALATPRDHNHIHFVTYTTRYGECSWLRIDGLSQHYTRGEVDASRDGDTVTITTKGVSRLQLQKPAAVTIDGQSFKRASTFSLVKGKWKPFEASPGGLRKRHALQGPIDDAFFEPFLCVRPNGGNPLALQRLETFRANYDKFFRADIPMKNESDVTDDDIRNYNLILFGDSKSNRLIGKLLPRLPFDWNARKIKIAGKTFEGENQLLVAIYPNPLDSSRYVVLNSGYTFSAKDLTGTNALLFPKLGDWAVLDAKGEVTAAGFFDESWR
ncbi:MAG: prolyl oligopeptidase family serine peptidase [Bryobacterales bacterium]|nr:prolyl oligopeptidase family serine peptidase [Bryobacterales bacterium]